MTDKQLSELLRQMKVNTKSLACLGCGYENKCSTKGCRLIGLAADRLAAYAQAVETIKAMHTAASGVGKSLLRDVLSLFDSWYGQAPEPPRTVYDFEICTRRVDLVAAFDYINRNQWELISVTFGPNGYTLFFRRPARE